MLSYDAEAWRLLIPEARDGKKWPDVRREQRLV